MVCRVPRHTEKLKAPCMSSFSNTLSSAREQSDHGPPLSPAPMRGPRNVVPGRTLAFGPASQHAFSLRVSPPGLRGQAGEWCARTPGCRPGPLGCTNCGGWPPVPVCVACSVCMAVGACYEYRLACLTSLMLLLLFGPLGVFSTCRWGVPPS